MSAPTPQHGLTERGPGPDQEPSCEEGRSVSTDPVSHSGASTSRPILTRVLEAEKTLGLGAILAVAADQTGVYETSEGRVADVRMAEQEVAYSFGDYEIFERIASGGMGVVYRARQKSLRRIVALKMILAGEFATPEELQRFRKESEAAAQLDHHGIVPIFEIGEHEGRPFFSMGYVEGGSLATWVKEGPLPCERAAELVLQVAEAVAYAHRQGIIHRDLKPSNILLDREGHPKVTDFGLAKQVNGLSHLTVTGQVLGTPSYMAPEQAAGKIHEVGPAADLYSLGALLYCLVTGRPPFQAATPIETLRQVLEQEPVSVRQLNGSASRDIETICRKCLQKVPAQRYGSAPALVDDLRRFLAGEPIQARPVGSAERFWRWCQRNPKVVALSSCFVLSLLLGIVTTSYFWMQARREATAAREAQERSERRRYAAEMVLAQQELEKGQIATVQTRLDSLRPQSTGNLELRGFEWHYLERLCHLELRTLGGSAGQVRGVAFSPDGRHLAAAGGRFGNGKPGTVQVWDSTSGEMIRDLAGHSTCANTLAYSPDGTRLASASGLPNHPGEVRLWDITKAGEVLNLTGHTAPVWSLAFSRDGQRLVGASGGYDETGRPLPGEVLVWDLAGGGPVRRLHGHQTAVKSVAWSPDDRWLASADTRGIVKIWTASDDKDVLTLPAHSSQVTSVIFSPDGSRLVTSSMDQDIQVWDTGSWNTQKSATPNPLFTLLHRSPVLSVAFSPDSQRLAAGYEDRSVRIWDLTTRRESLALQGHRDAVLSVAFSPDGWRLASAGADQTIKIWDATTDRRTRPLRDRGNELAGVQSIAFSPDGHRFASASVDGVVRIWDTASALVTRTLRGHTDTVREVAFSADSRWLASASTDRTVRIWDVATGKRLHTVAGFQSTIRSVAFAPDGRWLACASRQGKTAGAVMVWKLGSSPELATRPDREYHSDRSDFVKVAFSPDSQWLAGGSRDGSIQLWNPIAAEPPRMLRSRANSIADIQFSPDGRLLASASEDGTVNLWDVATGEPTARLTGHTRALRSVAFSPDGRRLVSAGSDLTVKFWDIRTGEEIFSIPVPWISVGLAFHRDGRRLAIGGARDAGSDHTIAIWDVRERTPELRDQDEARSRVAFWYARPLASDQVRERLALDPSIGEPVRERALALVDGYGQDLTRREAEDLILGYTIKGLLPAEILERLQTHPNLSEPVRREALVLAGPLVENSIYLNQASRAVVRRPDAESSAYQRALQQAETASRLTPYRGAYQTTLGMAQYRLGKYREAVETLIRADQLNATSEGGPNPADLAFLAMAQYRLGQKDQARATLKHLRNQLREPARSNQNEANGFHLEAEGLIENQP